MRFVEHCQRSTPVRCVTIAQIKLTAGFGRKGFGVLHVIYLKNIALLRQLFCSTEHVIELLLRFLWVAVDNIIAFHRVAGGLRGWL